MLFCSVCLTVCDVGVLWPNGSMDQDGRPRPWPHCVRWGPSFSHGKGHSSLSLSKFIRAGFACVHIIRGPSLLWSNSWMNQDAIWYRGRPQPRPHCVRWRRSSSAKKGVAAPQFSPHVYCGQTAGWIKMPLGREICLGSDHIVLDGDPAPLPQRGTAHSFRPMSVVTNNGRPSQLLLSTC